ncbi:aspartate carbamoyltransferase regulatory subunit [archaeon]|jgi:aspartate carbamoyltransferase regulatory subunit|nr:aspartate carbamoyltransferase regulatory subunit [archaeon]MBT4351533.1 aspartate carbamoyltransferase regulatory subunit [archaeon]MBT4647694.1 aspartate carbamoyltransferase regulatory subunit [archaeon]MBT6822366.1 aspartate carbamoyltransferase regulatory subunit [archaeon]MBT7391321.1 aspartate carbamoyltransferase regulatory subunit [archaeon]
MRAYKVYAIEEGTVIDHIESGKGTKVIELLNLKDSTDIISMGMNFESSQVGKKDIIKIENRFLTKDELNTIAIIAPTATINIIKKAKVAEKFKVELPDEFQGIIKCRNPTCITRNEPVKSKFKKFSESPLKVRCKYCEKVFIHFELL